MMKQVLNFIFILFLCLMMLPVRADMLVPVTDFFPPLHILEGNASSLIFFAIILSFIFGKRLYQKTHSKWQLCLFILLVFFSSIPIIAEYLYHSNFGEVRRIIDIDSFVVRNLFALVYPASFVPFLLLIPWQKTRLLAKYAFISSAINLCFAFLITSLFGFKESLVKISFLCFVISIITLKGKTLVKYICIILTLALCIFLTTRFRNIVCMLKGGQEKMPIISENGNCYACNETAAIPLESWPINQMVPLEYIYDCSSKPEQWAGSKDSACPNRVKRTSYNVSYTILKSCPTDMPLRDEKGGCHSCDEEKDIKQDTSWENICHKTIYDYKITHDKTCPNRELIEEEKHDTIDYNYYTYVSKLKK